MAFKHLVICRKYLANGTNNGGCSDKDKCGSVHPTMCTSSLKSRTCSKFGTGEKCREGYHLKNTTKSDVIQTKQTNTQSTEEIPNIQEVTSQERTSTINVDTMTAFLEKIVEKQVLKILGIQTEEKKVDSMDPLKALLNIIKIKN